MTGTLISAYAEALVSLGERDPTLVVVDGEKGAGDAAAPFHRRYPDRVTRLSTAAGPLMETSARLSTEGHRVQAHTPAAWAAGDEYETLRTAICRPARSVTVVATHGGVPVAHGQVAVVEDIGLMRALPGMSVIVPADGASTRAATLALGSRPGPAYLRLRTGEAPELGGEDLVLGRAREMRRGDDLTIVALGSLLERGLAAAEELARVGVSVRVLDMASVKPFDEPAVLRAARDTGAILVLEEHSVLTGVGALVASTTSENYPVPVRRVGVPDVFVEGGAAGATLDHYGMSLERIRDEAWELLRARGKVQ